MGNAGADVISGGDGNDTVTGGAGADNITLGAGADVVIIDSVANSTGTTIDTITDFVSGTDKINITLTTSDSNFDVSGFAVVSSFNDGIVSLSTSRGDAFYSTADGKLYVDDNGSGGINASLDHVVSVATLAAADINFVITGGAGANNIVGGAGADTIDGAANADVISGGAGNDNLTGGAGADNITGGTGTDTIVLGGGTDRDTVVFANNDSTVTIGGTGDAGTITGFDVVTGFVTGTVALEKDLLDFAGTATVGAIGTFALNGTNSSLTISGAAVGSHAITAGKITFHTGDAAGAAITVDSDVKLAAVVQYLIGNDIGAAADTLAFVYGADTFVYSQTATTAGGVGGYNLVKIVGVVVNALETTASTTDLNIFIG